MSLETAIIQNTAKLECVIIALQHLTKALNRPVYTATSHTITGTTPQKIVEAACGFPHVKDAAPDAVKLQQEIAAVQVEELEAPVAAVEKAVEETPALPVEKVLYTDVQRAVNALAKIRGEGGEDIGRKAAVAILADFGVTKGTELKEDQYYAVAQAFEAKTKTLTLGA